MSRISRNLSIILRAERTMARHQFRVLCQQIGLMAMAGLIAIIGIVMLNIAAYMGLAPRFGPAQAAAMVAGANLGLALVLVWIAGRFTAADDIAPLADVRDMAVEDLEAEIELATTQVVEVTDALTKLARDPLGAIGPGVLVPLITAIAGLVKRPSGSSDQVQDEHDVSL